MPRAYDIQKRRDDQAFPVRVRVVVPEGGLSTAVDMTQWLHANVGRAEYAQHGMGRSVSEVDTVAFYFRTVEAAQAFLDAYPTIALADTVDHPTYGAPMRSAYFYDQEALTCATFTPSPRDNRRSVKSPGR